jgi:2-polyprenyl-6-methoxyphenol hydroxylase-like FAD-dependent oxidoreductase
MPQWDFLKFLAEKARVYPQFQLHMGCEVTDLIEENGRVAGVRCKTPRGELEVRADLTIGADGRHSIVHEKAGLEVIDRSAPIDVLWVRLGRQADDPNQTLGRIRAGRILVTLDRGEYWQCAYLIPKGALEEIRRKGLASFREDIVKGRSPAPLVTAGTLVHRRFRSRNLAIQDAVAAANIMAESLLRGSVTEDRLRKVQQRREFPTRVTQVFQVFGHKRLLSPALSRQTPIRRLPLLLKILQWFPVLRRIPARLVGIAVRLEHVRSRAPLTRSPAVPAVTNL